jgi:hypothetical protein
MSKTNSTQHLNGGDRARLIVNWARTNNILPPVAGQTCVDCGRPATCYDHRDYNKPLEVEPVCHACNSVRGAAIPREDAPDIRGERPATGFVLCKSGIARISFQAIDFYQLRLPEELRKTRLQEDDLEQTRLQAEFIQTFLPEERRKNRTLGEASLRLLNA